MRQQARGAQIYFQCGEEMTTARDLELPGTIVYFGHRIFPTRGSWIWPRR